MKKLLKIADENNIPVINMALNGEEEALCHSIDSYCIIAIDERKLKSEADRHVKLAHELGHCMTGSFYDASCPVIPRGRCERRASRWAFSEIADKKEILSAIKKGESELWQLSEHFNVTEPFMRDMLKYYGLWKG